MTINKKINICDVSHRDGSYLNDFRIDALQTKHIVTCADKAGVDAVEVGHGLGISAGKFFHKSTLDDNQYCKIAKDNIKNAKWGTFCVAEKCYQDDLQSVLTYEPDFIKVGCDPDRYMQAEKTMAAIADSSVTEPVLFFMKTYAWKMPHMLDAISKSLQYGVKVAYLVDSAGTMIGSDVARIIKEFKHNFPEIEVGFHGHNNLGLAVSNSIIAIENGATHIDCSMLGVGRSGGNCCIEQLLFILDRMGIQTNIDVFSLLKFSEDKLPHIYPLQHIAPLDIIFGSSGFHSSFINLVREASVKHNIDINRLSYELGKITQISPSTEELNAAIATTLEKKWTAA